MSVPITNQQWSMPLEFQVIRASEFIRLDARAHVDFGASEKVLQELARACRKRGLGRALFDLRSLPALPRPQFTPNELARLVSTFREAGFTREQRLAILYHSDFFGGARNFAFISRMRGLDVQAFTEFETALHWLSESHDNREEHPQDETPIPIMKRRTEAKRLPADLTVKGRDSTGSRHREEK